MCSTTTRGNLDNEKSGLSNQKIEIIMNESSKYAKTKILAALNQKFQTCGTSKGAPLIGGRVSQEGNNQRNRNTSEIRFKIS